MTEEVTRWARRRRCTAAGRSASARVLADRPLTGLLADHVDRCLGCQADVAHARAIRKGLRAMIEEVEIAPLGLAGSVMTGLDGPIPAPLPSRRRLAPALAAATAAAAVAVLMARRRAAAAA